MSGWAGFWQIVIWCAVLMYFGLAFVIAIGGFFDVRKMFRRLREPLGTEAGRNGER
jgi:hypothetical protein